MRLVHQPGPPIRILFSDLLHFWAPTPPWSMIVPHNLVFCDFTENTGTDQIANRNLIRFAAMLRSDLNDQIPRNDRIARGLYFFENVAHGLLAVAVLAGLGDHL